MLGEPPLPEETIKSVSWLCLKVHWGIKSVPRENHWFILRLLESPSSSLSSLDLNRCWGGGAHSLPDKWRLYSHVGITAAKLGTWVNKSGSLSLLRTCPVQHGIPWNIFNRISITVASSRGQHFSLTSADDWPSKGFLGHIWFKATTEKGTWLYQCPACRTAQQVSWLGEGFWLSSKKTNSTHVWGKKVFCSGRLRVGVS